MGKKRNASSLISELKRKTRKAYNSEEKIRIVIEGIRGELSIAELCRREGIHQANYYKWSKDFMEAGKHRLNGDTMREANTSEVQGLKGENAYFWNNHKAIKFIFRSYSRCYLTGFTSI